MLPNRTTRFETTSQKARKAARPKAATNSRARTSSGTARREGSEQHRADHDGRLQPGTREGDRVGGVVVREPGRPEEQRQRADEDAQCRQARQERRLLDKRVVHGRDGGGVVETSGRKDPHEACEDHDRRHGQPGGSDPAKLFPIPQPCFRCRRLRKDVPRDLVLLLDDRKPERVGREEQERQGSDRFLRQDRD